MKAVFPILLCALLAGVVYWAWHTGKLAKIGLAPSRAPATRGPSPAAASIPGSDGGAGVTTTGVTYSRPAVGFLGTRTGF